jgi:hypothetical protein
MPADIHHRGQGIRKTNLTAFPSQIFTSKIGILNYIYLPTADPLKPFIAIRR